MSGGFANLTNDQKLVRLEELYAQIPKMKNCTGACEDSCTVVPITPFERGRIELGLGEEFRPFENAQGKPVCVALKDGKCTQYENRPMICRIFGTSKHPFLRCDHGCEPETWMSGGDVFRIMLEVQELCGEMDNPHNKYYPPLSDEQMELASQIMMKAEAEGT